MDLQNQHFITWRFSDLYDYPEDERRRDSWNLLRTLA